MVCPLRSIIPGIREFFGNINKDEEEDNKPDLIKDIDDEDELIKFIKEERTTLPSSLVYALENFIISSAVKRSRGIKEHNTMLIHISSRKIPANRLKPLVEEQISNMYRLYKFDEETKAQYKSIWQNDILIQSSSYLNEVSNDKWDEIENEIKNCF